MAKNWFNLSAGIIFLITGACKTVSAFGHAAILQRADPLFAIQFSHLMLAAGVVELLVGGICLFDKWKVLGISITAWLATCLLIYRLGLWWIGWRKPCNCLGDFADAIRLSPQATDMIMRFILAYLLVGSYATLYHLWRKYKRVSYGEVKLYRPNG